MNIKMDKSLIAGLKYITRCIFVSLVLCLLREFSLEELFAAPYIYGVIGQGDSSLSVRILCSVLLL